jgi:hypothetical protein
MLSCSFKLHLSDLSIKHLYSAVFFVCIYRLFILVDIVRPGIVQHSYRPLDLSLALPCLGLLSGLPLILLWKETSGFHELLTLLVGYLIRIDVHSFLYLDCAVLPVVVQIRVLLMIHIEQFNKQLHVLLV